MTVSAAVGVTEVTNVNCGPAGTCDTKDGLAMRLATNREDQFADGLYHCDRVSGVGGDISDSGRDRAAGQR